MNIRVKVKSKYFSGSLYTFLLIILTYYSNAFTIYPVIFHNSLTADTVPLKRSMLNPNLANNVNPTLAKRDTIKRDTLIKVSTDTFKFKTSNGALDAPVVYHADDSMILDVPGKRILLYGKKSTIDYNDNELSAPHIAYDQKTNLIKAVLVKDSLGNVISYPTFKQADFKSISDTLEFNMKSGKGLTKGTYTQQGELYVYGEKIKKVNPDVFYALRGRFTTCNLDTPHFAFVSSKIKFINKKMAFSGPVHPEFEGVPIPIILPFGIYPLQQGRHSGLIAPSFTANEQLGLALEGIGYYKILSPYWDVITRGTIYSYGGWTANINPRYITKYRYQGNFSLDLQRFKTNFKGDPDFSVTRTMNVRWTHNADTKARPGVNFSANVNAGSSKFNQQVPNSPVRNFTNQLNSSITYAKVWKDKPYNISVSANHNQNTTQKLININLPDVAFNVNTQYPFRRKEVIGDYKWYENVGVALNTQARSLSSFYDTAGNIGAQLIDRLQWGANHNVPITLSLPQLGPLQISPSISYAERWYQQKFIRNWNPLTQKVDTTINKGFYSARDMAYSLGASTRIFGMYTFKSKRLQAIRHEIRPTLGVSYKPDMNKQFYYKTQIDTFGNIAPFSVYDGSVFGAFGNGRFAGLNFGIDNNVSMKTRNKNDTSAAGVKKVSLLDGLSINGSYNFLADSFRLSDLSVAARSNLFEKVNITAFANFSPYLNNTRGEKIDKLVWSKKPLSLGTMNSAGVSLQSQFKGGKTGDPNATVNTPQNVDASGFPLDDYQREAAYVQSHPGEFVDFSIPWTLDVGYSLRVSRVRRDDYSGYRNELSQDVNWNSTVNLTPKWKIGLNGFYNITQKELGTISMFLSRDLHCWQMSINISPVGRFRFFNLTISPKSAILRDLKVNRTRYFYDF
ncbi:MAG: putative LPS assembly protein LptD [Ferruginibacter sp.]